MRFTKMHGISNDYVYVGLFSGAGRGSCLDGHVRKPQTDRNWVGRPDPDCAF